MTDLAKEARDLIESMTSIPLPDELESAEALARRMHADGVRAGMAKAAEIARVCLVDRVMGATIAAAILAAEGIMNSRPQPVIRAMARRGRSGLQAKRISRRLRSRRAGVEHRLFLHV